MNHPPITRDLGERLAEEWVAAWNAHDQAGRVAVETFKIGETGRWSELPPHNV